MDLTAYINSGVLELYVLDRLSPDERRRVEAYAAEYPEVRAEIEQIELGLERYAVLHGEATPPDPSVLASVLDGIKATAAVPPAPTAPPPATPVERNNSTVVWIMLAALALAVAALVYLYLQNQQQRSELEELSTEFAALEADCQQVAANYQATEEQIALLTDIGTRGIVLAGTDNAPESRAQVFYNQNQSSVLFTASNLPAPPTGRQYQLWALDAAGNPQNLGVLDQGLSSSELLNVPFVPNASAFAITLEVEGGRPTPDLSQLQVIGEVGS